MDARVEDSFPPVRLTLRQISYFVAAAEEQHFHRAAQRLHISQPPLTQRIQELERALGVQLFARKGSRIDLTRAGRLVLAEAKAVLAQVDRVQEVARRAGQGRIGNLSVAIVISVAFLQTFMNAVNEFRRDHQSIDLEVVQAHGGIALEMLRRGKTDICIVRQPSPSLTNGLLRMVVARDQLMLVLPSNHPKAHAEKVALSDIADERFIASSIEYSVSLKQQITDLWRRADAVPRIIQRGDNGPAMMSMVAGGFGNAILPSTFRRIHMPDLVWKPIDMDEKLTSSTIVMLYSAERQNEKIQSIFIDYVRRFSDPDHKPAARLMRA